MAKDPVCGMNVDETSAAAETNYKGTTYYFCAQGCLREFLKDPEKYLKLQGVSGGRESKPVFKTKQR